MDANSEAAARRNLESALSRLEGAISDFISKPARHRLPSGQIVADPTDAFSALGLESAAKLVKAEAEALARAWESCIREKVPYRELLEQLVGQAQSFLTLVEGLRLDNVGVTKNGDVIAACRGSRGWPEGKKPCLSAALGAATWTEATNTRSVNDDFSDGVDEPDPSQVFLDFQSSLDVLLQLLIRSMFTALADRLKALMNAAAGHWEQEDHARRAQDLIRDASKISKVGCSQDEAGKLQTAAAAALSLSVDVGRIVRKRESEKRRADKAAKRIERDHPEPVTETDEISPPSPVVKAPTSGPGQPLDQVVAGAQSGVVVGNVTPAAALPARPLDLLTTTELVRLIGVTKSRFYSRMREMRASGRLPPEPIESGGNGKSYSFAAIRPWLNEAFPLKTSRLGGSYEEIVERIKNSPEARSGRKSVHDESATV